MHSTFKNLVVSMVVGTVGFVPVGHAATLTPGTATNTYKTSSSPQSSIALIEPKAPVITVRDDLDRWLDDLAQAESHGNEMIRVLDTNGRFSYGCLQFQIQTFGAYGKKYGILNGNTSDEKLHKLVYDCSIQKEIARAMIEDNTENWRHWYNSVRHNANVGLPPVAETEDLETVLARFSN